MRSKLKKCFPKGRSIFQNRVEVPMGFAENPNFFGHFAAVFARITQNTLSVIKNIWDVKYPLVL